MTPHLDLASTRYCLANQGHEYFVFQPADKSGFTLDLEGVPGTLSAEWFNVNTGALVPALPVRGGAVVKFAAPFDGPAGVTIEAQAAVRLR